MHFNLLNTRKVHVYLKSLKDCGYFLITYIFKITSTVLILMLCNQEKSRWEEKKSFAKTSQPRWAGVDTKQSYTIIQFKLVESACGTLGLILKALTEI